MQLNICLGPSGALPQPADVPNVSDKPSESLAPVMVQGRRDTTSNPYFKGAFQRQCARNWKIQRRALCFPLVLLRCAWLDLEQSSRVCEAREHKTKQIAFRASVSIIPKPP